MILVLVEPEGGGHTAGTSAISLEALAFARSVAAELAAGASPSPGDPDVQALVVGPYPAPMPAELGEHGARVLHHGDDPRLERYGGAAWAAAVVDVVRRTSPAAVIAAGSPRGSEVLAHVAARLQLPLAANCVTIRTDPDEGLVASRQVMGGAALEEVRVRPAGPGEQAEGIGDGPVLLTMAGHAVEPEPVPDPVAPDLQAFSPNLSEADLITQVRSVEPVARGGEDLVKARVVVGAGRGVGGGEQFGDLLELTELLGGALGVSRVVTSLGWRPHHEQVGQTGSRISPDVYLACGISGAIQHWAGCSSARTIIAINTDPDAPMVTKADYAVIGDLHEIVPAISAELRARFG